MRDLRVDREPVRVVDVLESKLLEHLSWLEIIVDDTSGDVFVLLGQSLWHQLNSQWSKPSSLETLIDLKWSEWSHFDSDSERENEKYS